MQLHMCHVEQALILEIEGRLDAYTCERLQQLWQDVYDERFFIIDLSRVDFMDSLGLATLVTGLKIARELGGDLLLVNPTPAIRIILDLTAMLNVFPIVASVDEATSLVASQL